MNCYSRSISNRIHTPDTVCVSQSIYNLKDASKMMNFLTGNNIMDMAGLDKFFSGMIDRQMDIGDRLKPIERRLPVLKKHLEQYEIYLMFKGRKALSEAEQIRKSVYSILRQEQLEQQPRRAQEVDR